MARQTGASSFVAIPLSVLQAEESLPLVEVGKTPEGEPIMEPAIMVGKTWWNGIQIAKLKSGKVYTLQAVSQAVVEPTPPAEEEDTHKIAFTISSPRLPNDQVAEAYAEQV